MNYYFLGWMEQSIPAELGQSLKNELFNKHSIVYISGDPHNLLEKGTEEKSWFQQLQITFDQEQFIDAYTPTSVAQQAVMEAEVIFLLGGYPLLQLELLKEKQIFSLLQESSAVIIGASAGAINMGASYACTPLFGFDVKQSFIAHSLALQPFAALAHFDLSNPHAICTNEFIQHIQLTYPVYIFNKHCGIHVKNNTMTYYGDIFLIEDGLFKLCKTKSL